MTSRWAELQRVIVNKSMTLQITREDAILRLTLNRPEKRNALSTGLCAAIADAVESLLGRPRHPLRPH